MICLSKSLLVLVALISLSGSFVSSLSCETKSTIPVKTYKINLDLAPQDRFDEVISDFKEEVLALIATNKKSLNIPPRVIKILELLAGEADGIFPYPYNEELKGIAAALNTNLGDVVIANLLYDLTAFCTGVIAIQENGQIIHGRNLDYNFMPYLKNVTYKAQFYKNGSLLFTTTQFAGYIGILTGHKYNAFTFSLNERDQGHWWDNLIAAITERDVKALSFLTRDVMEKADNFDQAVKIFSNAELIAPVYFIVAGVKGEEGVVLTRNQTHLIDRWQLDLNSKSFNKWFLLETNYDHWVPPPSSDDRRTPGIKAMNATTQARINKQTLIDVMVTQPVCNSQTVYTTYMSAVEQDSMEIIVH